MRVIMKLIVFMNYNKNAWKLIILILLLLT